MKFSVVTGRMQTLFVTQGGTFDGSPPVAHLEVGHHFQGMNVDRVAVGLSLIYAPWLSGPVEFPEPVSALTAQRLTRFFGDRFVTASPFTDRAQPLPRGSRTVMVRDGLRSAPDGGVAPSIRLVPFTQGEGSLWSAGDLIVASNVALLADPEPNAWPAGLHTLGLATLLAEDVDASVLVHPASGTQSSGLGQLLEAVGLGLAADVPSPR